MSFENFYEESDKAARRWWKCVGAAFLLFIGYWTVGLLATPDPQPVQQPREIQQPPLVKSINTERRRRVNELCINLSKPEKFHLADKTIVVENHDLTLIRYSFKSDRSWDEIMPFFLVWLNANGWKSLPNNKFTFIKDNQAIAFRTVANDTVNYEILCSEKEKEGEAVTFGPEDI